MGSVAAAIQAQGETVLGSEADLYEPMKSLLQNAGVHVFPEFNPNNILAAQPDAIVVGNAVSRGNEELEVALDHRLTLTSLPALITDRLISKNTSVVIAGTHGKTTTTAMTAWLLEATGHAPGFLIGGVPGNFPVGCRPVPADRHNTPQGVFVTEGDEYDSAYFDKRSKFLHYRPDIAVINNIEFDHSDIFDTLDDVLKTFRLFSRLIPRNGLLLVPDNDPNVARILPDCPAPIATFGFTEDAEFRATDLTATESGHTFTLTVKSTGDQFGPISVPLSGHHNVRNMLAACAIALRLGTPGTLLPAASTGFIPPARRLQVVTTYRGCTVIDDFAHHPTAIAATIEALRLRYPGRRLFVAFEPRSNTTTRNLFQTELAQAFTGADGVLIGALDRPHRYTEAERLDTNLLVRQIESSGASAYALPLELGQEKGWGLHLLTVLNGWIKPGDVIATLSNGDFGGLRKLLLTGE